MSGGKGGGQETQSTVTQSMPEWMKQPFQGMMKYGFDVANRPYQAYGGKTVANLDPMTQRAIDYTGQQQGVAGQQMQGFLPGMQQVAGYQPEQVGANQFAGMDLNPYMNPYTQNVVNTSMAQLERQRQQAQNQNLQGAQQAGAFGGSRHGLTEAATNEAAMRQAGELSANLYNQGWGQATGLAQSDLARRMQAEQLNQAAGLQGADLRRMAGLGGAQIAQQAQQANLSSAAAAQQAGQLRQQQQQAQMMDRYQRWQERRDYPEHQLDIIKAMMGMMPTGQGTTTTQGPGGNPWLSALGGGLGGAGLGFQLGGPWGAALGGLGGLGMGLMG